MVEDVYQHPVKAAVAHFNAEESLREDQVEKQEQRQTGQRPD